MGYIYKIKNDINDKLYIGQTVNSLEQRFIEHKSHCLNNNKKYPNRPLYNAINKYGIEHFNIELIEECSNEKLNEREKYWIQYYNSYNNGYNATLGGDSTILYNYQDIIDKYNQTKNISEVARQTGAAWITVKRILKNNGIEVEKHPLINKKVYVHQYDLKDNKLINIFVTYRDAATYILENNLSNTKNIISIINEIRDNVNNKIHSAYGFKWNI